MIKDSPKTLGGCDQRIGLGTKDFGINILLNHRDTTAINCSYLDAFNK